MKGLSAPFKLTLPALPPRQSILALLTFVFLLNALLIYFMLEQPRFGISLQLVDGKIFAAETSPYTPAGLQAPRELMALAIPDYRFELEAEDLLEEPDLLPHYSAYNRFMQRQSMLFDLLQYPRVELFWSDQTSSSLVPRKTVWSDLPLMFWFQLIVASFSLLVGAAVWLFRQRDRAALHYFLIGVFLALVIFPAAIYSSRELALDGELFRVLSVVDHLGLYIVMAAIISLVWCYPQPLWAFPFPALFYSLMYLCWVMDTVQWFPDLDVSTRIVPLLMLVLGFVLLIVHWKRSA